MRSNARPTFCSPLKTIVDGDKTPARFLLTGSANLMTIPKVADSLAGRMEVARLMPLSKAEILGTKSEFIVRAFAGERPTAEHMIVGGELVENVLSGGYPEALGRTRWSRKQDWYHSYLDAIVQRDVRDVALIEQIAIMLKLISVLAEHSGQLVNYMDIGARLDLNHVTTQKYLRLGANFATLLQPPCRFGIRPNSVRNNLTRITKALQA